MTDFRATKVISSIKSKNSFKECDHCKAIEILKHQSCKELCLADSFKEQKLISEKIKKTLTRPLPALLSSILSTPHQDFTSRLSLISQKLETLSSANVDPPVELQPEPKLKMLEEKLNRIEDLLNTRAAEIYDLKEQVQIIENPKSDFLNLSEIFSIKEDLKKQKKILDEKKFLIDGARLDVLKLKKERPKGKSKKDLESEVAYIKDKNKYIEKMVDRLQIFQKSITDRVRLAVTSLEGLKSNVKDLQNEQKSISFLRPESLVQISKKVFSSYRVLKEEQEKKLTKVNETLEKFKEFPELLPKITEIQEEIEHWK